MLFSSNKFSELASSDQSTQQERREEEILARKETSKMRFLCLHGRGTNSDIFESQLGKRDTLASLLQLE